MIPPSRALPLSKVFATVVLLGLAAGLLLGFAIAR